MRQGKGTAHADDVLTLDVAGGWFFAFFLLAHDLAVLVGQYYEVDLLKGHIDLVDFLGKGLELPQKELKDLRIA